MIFPDASTNGRTRKVNSVIGTIEAAQACFHGDSPRQLTEWTATVRAGQADLPGGSRAANPFQTAHQHRARCTHTKAGLRSPQPVRHRCPDQSRERIKDGTEVFLHWSPFLVAAVPEQCVKLLTKVDDTWVSVWKEPRRHLVRHPTPRSRRSAICLPHRGHHRHSDLKRSLNERRNAEVRWGGPSRMNETPCRSADDT